MKKAISLNGKPRNTNKSKGPRFSAPGFVPSFSNVIAAVIREGPREKSIEEQSEAIIKNIKKLERRIKKAKVFCNVPVSRETDETADARRKIARWEALVNKQHFTLHYLHARKNSVDRREVTKFLNKQAEEAKPGNEHHRLSPAKVVAESVTAREKQHRPMVLDSKKSTSKRKVYKVFDPSVPTSDKADKEWRELVKANTRD